MKIYIALLLPIFIVACATGQTTETNINHFTVEDGIRIDYAAQTYAITKNVDGFYEVYNKKSDGIYLTYKDTTINQKDDTTILNPTKVAYSKDGLLFEDSTEFQTYEKPGVLIPGTEESPIYKKFILKSDGLTSSTSYNNGETYEKDEGYRYTFPDNSEQSIGYYDVFNNGQGQIILMYIGNFMTSEESVHLAISEDNGENFVFISDNVLEDKGLNDQGLNYRDPRITMLNDGTLKVYTMVPGKAGPPIPGKESRGYIYSHTSKDGGYTWTLDEGIRLQVSDFPYDVWSLNDPHVVQLENGQLRMYVTARIEDQGSETGYKEVLISAISG